MISVTVKVCFNWLRRATICVAFSSNGWYHFLSYVSFSVNKIGVFVKKFYKFGYSVVLLSALVLQTFAQNTTSRAVLPKPKETAISAPAKATTTVEKVESDMAEALTLIQDNHVNGKKLDYNDLFKSSIDSMLHVLDPHSNYFDAKEYEQFRTDQSSQYFGIGASIDDLQEGNTVYTYIKATFEGAPAQRAGLRYGDKILDVNGTSMVGKPFQEVRTFLRGPRGTTAKITVEHYATGKKEVVEIIRDAVPQPSIPEAYMIRPGVGYIAMTGGFNQTTYAEFRQAMQQLKAQGMQNLILDIRNNGGGLVSQAYRVANSFLSRGQAIFTQKGRIDGTGETYRAENTAPETMPLVVLVNRNSASASEILSGALQDHDRALIVGENTFGKGLVQNPFVLEYGSMVLLTIAKYETPSGRLIQRDYSDGSLYAYYFKGGTLADDTNAPQPPKGPESKTDSGRPVYGGGGIQPDEVVKPLTIPAERFRQQQKLADPAFAFSMAVAFGKTAGFDTYRVDRPIKYNYDIKATDFPVSEEMFQSFKKFAIDKYKIPASVVDKEKEFVLRLLRTEFITASYGMTTSFQVSNEYDNQLLKAIDLLPRAKQLAMEGAKAYAQKNGSENDK